MKRLRVWLSIFGFLAVLVGTGSLIIEAGYTPFKPRTLAPPKIPLSVMEGSIADIALDDPAPNMIVAKADGQVALFFLDLQSIPHEKATLVSINKWVVPANELTPGQRVRIQYEVQEGNKLARFIEILAPLPMTDFNRHQRFEL